MIFPFWYNSELVFYKSDNTNYNVLLANMLKKNKGKQTSSDSFEWQSKKGIFNTRILVKFKINNDELTLHVRYFISMFESNILLLLGVVFALFFMFNNQTLLVVLSLVVGLLAWFVNITRVSFYIKKQFRVFGFFNNNVNRQYLWQQQQKWIKQKNLCPACGEILNPYSANCTQCGLAIQKNKKKLLLHQTNTTYNLPIKINYKKK